MGISYFHPLSELIPRVVNLRHVADLQEWLEDPRNAYIGRCCKALNKYSIWANPFKIGGGMMREDVIRQYAHYYANNNDLKQKLYSLCGKNLGCWCAPEPCHGDVLIAEIKKALLMT